MIQKYLSDKKVFWISIFFAIGGLISPLFTFDQSPELVRMFGSYFKSIVEIIYVSYFNFENFFSIEIPSGKDGTYILYNLLNAFFYILLLIGSILFITSNKKETRLLRFVFSIIFLSMIAKLTVWVTFVISYFEITEPNIYIHLFVNFLINAFQIYLAYSILKYISQSKILSTSIREYGEKQSIILNETSRWTRFFHHIIDILVMILILSPIARAIIKIPFIENLVNSTAQSLGDRPTLFIIIAIFTFIYYFIFEVTFGMTAAKMLSETRVVDENGNHPTKAQIAKRSLLRLVPFENFTFFMAIGLHDRSSETYVINEERTGIKGSWYFLLIPIFLILGGGTWFGINSYKKAQSHKIFEAEQQQEKEMFADNIKNLTTNEVLTLKAVNYDSKDIFIKVENVTGDSFTFVVLDPQKEYKNTAGEILSQYQTENYIEKIYEMEKNAPTVVRFSKSELISSDDLVKGEYGVERKKGITVLGKQFSIYEINSHFGPNFQILDVDYGTKNKVVLKNYGWTADLISVSDAQLESDQLPVTLNKNGYNTAVLIAKTPENFKFIIKAKDTLNRIFIYEISQKQNLPAVIKKIK